jgi:hypothetical protein
VAAPCFADVLWAVGSLGISAAEKKYLRAEAVRATSSRLAGIRGDWVLKDFQEIMWVAKKSAGRCVSAGQVRRALIMVDSAPLAACFSRLCTARRVVAHPEELVSAVAERLRAVDWTCAALSSPAGGLDAAANRGEVYLRSEIVSLQEQLAEREVLMQRRGQEVEASSLAECANLRLAHRAAMATAQDEIMAQVALVADLRSDLMVLQVRWAQQETEMKRRMLEVEAGSKTVIDKERQVHVEALDAAQKLYMAQVALSADLRSDLLGMKEKSRLEHSEHSRHMGLVCTPLQHLSLAAMEEFERTKPTDLKGLRKVKGLRRSSAPGVEEPVASVGLASSGAAAGKASSAAVAHGSKAMVAEPIVERRRAARQQQQPLAVCGYCGQSGHFIGICPVLDEEVERDIADICSG